MNHRIRRQILELELPRAAGALDVQRRASRVFQEKVLPELDVVFGKIAPVDRYVRIERLEIDLADLTEGRWEQEFVEQCIRQIARQVAESALEAGSPDTPPSETLDPEANACNILLYFLDTGTLPWYAKGISVRDLAPVLKKASIAQPDAFRSRLLPALRRKPEVLQRLVWQFSPETTLSILETALNLPEDWLTQAIRILESQTGRPLPATERLQLFRILLSEQSVSVLQQLPEPPMLARLFMEQMSGPTTPYKPVAPPEPAANEARTPDLEAAGETPFSTSQATEEAKSSEYKRPAPEPAGGEQPAQRKPEPEPQPAPSVKPAPATIPPEGVLVDNAGLVLFAPYLPAFFAELGLLNPAGNQFAETGNLSPANGEQATEELSEQSPVSRAIHLLDHLATGIEHPEEHRLLLPKILCGLPPDTPVPSELALTETEKNEAIGLMEAIIRNWPALKNTGVEGFRHAFIQRNGQISWQEGRQAWLLQVERLAQDILLERLPWGFSVIKLPWMEKMVQVEW